MASEKTTNKQVSANIDAELHAFIEDQRWAKRLKMSDVVRTAVEDWAAREGYKPAATADEATIVTQDAPTGKPSTPKA